MYLFEFSDQELLVNIVSATDQLKQAIKRGDINSNWTLDQLLDYFNSFDVVLSNRDIYNMIQVDPLKSVISDVKGQEVVFKGLPQQPKTPEMPSPEQSKEVVAKMAKKALGK